MQLTLPDTTALTDRSQAVCATLQRAGDVVSLSPEASALIESGLRVQELLDRVADDLEIAESLVIDSPDMLADAEQIASRLAAVASASGEIEKERKSLTGPLNDVVRLINLGYNAPREHVLRVLGDGQSGLKGKILAFHQKQRAEAAERERKAALERERIAREAAAAEAAARAQAEALVQEAQQAQAAGSEIAAQALVQQASSVMDQARTESHAAVQAMHTAAPVVSVAKAKGVRGKWSAVLVSKENLIVHIANRIAAGDLSLVGLLDVNESACNRKAGIEEQGFNVPGLRASFSENIATRRAATV